MGTELKITERNIDGGKGGAFGDLFRRMGPAWIISAVACGPATMASVSIAGALYGYKLLWVVVLSALFAFVVQFMAAKIGILAGKGIISLVTEKLGESWGWVLMLDALLATWLATAVLMKALVDVTGAITGLPSFWWAAFYAVLISLLLGVGGYPLLEKVCKGLVCMVVGAFLATLFSVDLNHGEILRGLIPNIPDGIDSALVMAGIMGGAVHVTIIAMHTYNVNARGWGSGQIRLAWLDTFLSMFIAFGLYSAAIYLPAAAILNPKGTAVNSVLDVANALKPFWGPYSNAIILAGIWGGVVSTIVPTFLAAAYFIGDKMGWPLNKRDNRFRAVVIFGCLLSLIGPLMKGSFLTLLVVMLAVGLCGTPFIIAMVMILLNRKDVVREKKNSSLLNAFGALSLLITSFLAIRFIVSKVFL